MPTPPPFVPSISSDELLADVGRLTILLAKWQARCAELEALLAAPAPKKET